MFLLNPMNQTDYIFTENNIPNYLYIWSVFVCTVIPFFYFWIGFREDEKPQINNVPRLQPKEKSITEKDEDYLAQHRTRFLKLFSDESNENNSQINPILYDLSELSELLQDENNDLEKEWKTRIMLKNTHRGNIVMHYNIYKQGFSYYADQQFIPYFVLNAMAMEYVRLFRCLDFFMDEVELPEGNISKLITIQQLEEKKEKEEKKRVNKIDDLNLKNAPFAKFKSVDNSSANGKKEEKKQQLFLKKRNCFIYGGKIRDMKVWKTDAKEKTKINFKTDLLPKENMGYAAYKRFMREQNK